MEQSPQMRLPPLQDPPIHEVVCGFHFAPTNLTMLDFGVYWEGRRQDFPRHEIHPLLLDTSRPLRLSQMNDARVWMVSNDDSFVVQMQRDQFFVNWRRRGTAYPRFSIHGDGNPGVKARALGELKRFCDFVFQRTGKPVAIKQLTLTKVDLLEEGVHYGDMDELYGLMPITRVFKDVLDAAPTNLALNMNEQQAGGLTVLSLAMDAGKLRLETQHMFAPPKDDNLSNGDGLNTALDGANERVNDIFAKLINVERLNAKKEADRVSP